MIPFRNLDDSGESQRFSQKSDRTARCVFTNSTGVSLFTFIALSPGRECVPATKHVLLQAPFGVSGSVRTAGGEFNRA